MTESSPSPEQPASSSPRAAWGSRFDARLAALAVGMPPDVLPSPGSTPRRIPTAKLDRLARSLPGADVGVSVRDLHSGEEIFAWHADAALNPASNHKLLTASAALALLGSDFRFETHVRRAGDTLYLIGGGDPSLQVEDLQALVDRLDPAALEGVTRLAYDDAMFSARKFGPGYDVGGPGFSYMAPSGALSLQFNTLEIEVSPSAEGTAARVRVSPASDHVEVRNTATTLPRRHAIGVRTRANGERTVVEVSGALPRDGKTFKIRRRIADPGHFAASVFARLLAQHRQAPELPVVAEAAPARTEALALHRSAVLPDVLSSALKYSNNFTIEQVLRTLGHLDTGEPGDWDNGAAVLRRFWVALGEDPQGLQFENASGLSAIGHLSPRALTRLTQLWAQPAFDVHDVVHALPVAGREGTLHDRLHGSRGRVRAKTGTLTGATALTGVISDPAGDPALGFSIVVNGPVSASRARRIQDRIVLALVDAPPR